MVSRGSRVRFFGPASSSSLCGSTESVGRSRRERAESRAPLRLGMVSRCRRRIRRSCSGQKRRTPGLFGIGFLQLSFLGFLRGFGVSDGRAGTPCARRLNPIPGGISDGFSGYRIRLHLGLHRDRDRLDYRSRGSSGARPGRRRAGILDQVAGGLCTPRPDSRLTAVARTGLARRRAPNRKVAAYR